MEETQTKLGELVEEIRTKRDWTNYKLAIALGISESHCKSLRTVASSASIPLLCKLREVSGMTWKQFGKKLEGIARSNE